MSKRHDVEMFDTVIEDLSEDFTENPFEYGNEDMIAPELYRRLRNSLNEVRLPVEFQTHHGGDGWKVEAAAEMSNKGSATRIRTETAFVHDSEPWKPDTRSTTFRFDLSVVTEDGPMVVESKDTGPSNYLSTENELSVLAEVKHSKNRDGTGFYNESKGASDVRALGDFPGAAQERVFLFFDWWPEESSGGTRYERYLEKLRENVTDLSEPVTVIYVPRIGDSQRTTLK